MAELTQVGRPEREVCVCSRQSSHFRGRLYITSTTIHMRTVSQRNPTLHVKNTRDDARVHE
jgi:hypothetical protein